MNYLLRGLQYGLLGFGALLSFAVCVLLALSVGAFIGWVLGERGGDDDDGGTDVNSFFNFFM